ncbi:MAG TPA: hypothetical protein PKE12_03855 [Kiritimatiellia bacterium]|nr:hypothetical protein [Kiritimatiellia bacterium]
MDRPPPDVLISDSNVLIDFANADLEALGLVVRAFSRVYTARGILREVKNLTLAQTKRIGVELCDPTMAELMESAARGGALSARDKLCFAIAKHRQWGCLTNDRGLRNVCIKVGVPVVWGLEAILIAHRKGHLSKARATRAGMAIQRSNPHHIGPDVLDKFLHLLDA